MELQLEQRVRRTVASDVDLLGSTPYVFSAPVFLEADASLQQTSTTTTPDTTYATHPGTDLEG